MSANDDFWGNTPDWTDTTRSDSTPMSDNGPARSSRRTGGSRFKKMWGSAMSAGSDATREHRIVSRDHAAVDDTALDDTALDDTIPVDRDEEWAAAWPVDDAVPAAAIHGVIDDVVDNGIPVDDEIEYDFTPEFAERRSDSAVPAGGVDPLLARFGAVVVVLTLLVPLVVGLRANGPGDLLAEGDLVVSPTAAEMPAAATVAPADSNQSVMPEVTYLDPSQLPPAIPVNTEPVTSTESDELARPAAADDASTAGTIDDAVGTDRLIATEEPAAGDDGIATPADADDSAERVRIDCPVDYVVQEGDFWIRLADAADVSLGELYAVNGATADTPLYPGADICLPAGASTPAPPTTSAPAPSTTAPTVTTTAAPTTTSTTTTTAAPTTTSTTVAPTPVGPDEVTSIIRDVWPDELEERALEVAFRESRFVPTAKNFCCYGLFQIYWNVHQSWLADLGITSDDQLFDPETNARAAYALYQRAGGWGPWAL